MDEDNLLTVAEVVALGRGVVERTVRRWIATGQVEVVRRGRIVYVTEGSARAALAKREKFLRGRFVR